ncbi:MAG: hypothetical protein AAGI38_21785 [Bacteroidota bacterium]
MNTRKFFFLAIVNALLLTTAKVKAQDLTQNMIEQINYEGTLMYKLQMMARHSSEYLYDQGNMENLQGYVTYRQFGVYKCIYWNGAYDNLEVIHTFTVADPERPEYMQIDNTPRNLTPYEEMLYDIKMKALLEVRGNPSVFVPSSGAQFNVLFVEGKSTIKAYVISEALVPYTIPLGNHYLLNFTKKGELLGREVLSNTPTQLPAPQTPPAPEEEVVRTFHKIAGEGRPFLTPPDICNLLFYSPQPDVHEHHAASATHISIYKLNDRSLFIVPKNAVEQIKE